jgi:hypothetical protein
LIFWVRNEGNVAAYKWTVALNDISGTGIEALKINREHFPRPFRRGGIRVGDDTILPGLIHEHSDHELGFSLPTAPVTVEEMVHELESIFTADAFLSYRAVSETSRGEIQRIRFRDVLALPRFAEEVLQKNVEA